MTDVLGMRAHELIVRMLIGIPATVLLIAALVVLSSLVLSRRGSR